MTTIGEYLVNLLECQGVEKVFGIPGVHTAELYRGLAASSIQHITPRHEQGAGFMADGYARVTGKPGVCFVITGPGLSNIATAMLQAKADSIPMLVVSGVNDPGSMSSGRGYLHEMPEQKAFGAQTAAFSHSILTPEELPEVMARAFAIFQGARPGPVHIEIPLSLMEHPSEGLPEPRPFPPISRPAADPAGLDRAVAACRQATSPVMIIGGGARSGAAAAVALAERLDCPLLGTINARASLPLDHPLAVPANGSLASVRKLIDGADLVLAFGTELGPTDFDLYNKGKMIAPRKLIRVDIDPQQLCRGCEPDIPLIGDAKSTMEAMLDALDGEPAENDGAGRTWATNTAAFAEMTPAYQDRVRLLDAIRDRVPNATFVGDSTQLVYAGNMYFAPGNQGDWFNSSVGYGTLGYALPAALGAKIGAPDRPAIALLGDGGIQFTLGELGSIADSGLPVVVVVWNNDGYGEIKSYMENRQIEPEGVDLTPPDFALVAQAFGLNGVVLDRTDELPETIENALNEARSTVIEIRGV